MITPTPAALGPLTDRLAKLCASMSHGALDVVRDRLADPCVRVAVVGRLNAGKSTLVNALLHHSVAPVAAGECTRVTTTFGYAAREQAVVELVDGGQRVIPLGLERRLPADLPVDSALVRQMRVDLSSDVLHGMTLIDTPGLDTTSRELAGAAERLLGIAGADESSEVDAIVYVMPQTRGTDVERLTRLRDVIGDQGAALATIGVLTKADRLTPENSLAVAARMAGELSRELRGTLAAVLPVVGLWAETADANGLTEDDVRGLRNVAALDEGPRFLALSSAQRFVDAQVDVPKERLQRLVERLDITGIRALLDAGIDLGSAQRVGDQLREWSGIADLRTSLDRLVRERGDLLRAHSAVEALRRIAWSSDLSTAQREQLLDGIDAVETAPEYHVWHEARAMVDFVDGAGTGDAALDEEAIRMLTSIDTRTRLGLAESAPADEALEAAIEAYRRWTSIVNSPQASLSARRASEVVRRSYLLCYRQLAGT